MSMFGNRRSFTWYSRVVQARWDNPADQSEWITTEANGVSWNTSIKSASVGGGVDPNIADLGMALFVPKGAMIRKVSLALYCSSTDITELENYLYLRYPTATADWTTGISSSAQYTVSDILRDTFYTSSISGQPALTGATTEYHRRNYKINWIAPEDGLLTFAQKETGALTGNRLARGAIAWEMSI